MDITFLLGNGFDMQLGMKTGYRSFLEWYTIQPTTDDDIAKFREYLKDEKGEWWSDAEIAMGKYLGQFSDSDISVYYKNIRDFKLRLSEYLISENKRYDIASHPTVVEEFKRFMLESADDIMLRKNSLTLNSKRRHADTNINFVTFNYTDAIDRIIDAIKLGSNELEKLNGYTTRLKYAYHVHGTLDSSLIMGVANFEQLDTSKVSDNVKLRRTLIKPIINDELGRNDHTAAASLIRSSSHIFIYGLSFGDTDMQWWKNLKEKLMTDASCQVVLFTRSSAGDIQTIIPEDILDYESDKKDEFLLKIGVEPEYYDRIRKQVFVIRNTERLHISIDNIKATATV